jgi:acyl carrier protein
MTDTEKKMTAIIRDLFGELVQDLDAPLASGPTLDSLDVIELIMETEEKFGVEISDEEAEPFATLSGGKTVRDWCALVDGKLAARVLV